MENQDKPLVSVIIPAYNAQAFIAKTLESVTAQTYPNLEILVVDDGSQDLTPQIVQNYIEQDSRIHLFRQSNAGVAAARNLAIQKSQGEFIAPLDSDDIWYPTNIEKQVHCILSSKQDVGVIYSWSIDIDEFGQPTSSTRASMLQGKVFNILLLHDFLANASCTLIRRSCLEDVGGYSCEMKMQNAQGCEDWHLYLKIAHKYQFRVVPEFLVGYRQISNSMSSKCEVMAQSQHFMLQDVKVAIPRFPNLLIGLSKSSFYMYLARQCLQLGNNQEALLWLLKSIKVGFLTTLLRPDFYIIFLKIGLGSTTDKIQQQKNYSYALSQKEHEPRGENSLISQSQTNKTSLSHSIKIYVELILQNILFIFFDYASKNSSDKSWIS